MAHAESRTTDAVAASPTRLPRTTTSQADRFDLDDVPTDIRASVAANKPVDTQIHDAAGLAWRWIRRISSTLASQLTPNDFRYAFLLAAQIDATQTGDGNPRVTIGINELSSLVSKETEPSKRKNLRAGCYRSINNLISLKLLQVVKMGGGRGKKHTYELLPAGDGKRVSFSDLSEVEKTHKRAPVIPLCENHTPSKGSHLNTRVSGARALQPPENPLSNSKSNDSDSDSDLTDSDQQKQKRTEEDLLHLARLGTVEGLSSKDAEELLDHPNFSRRQLDEAFKILAKIKSKGNPKKSEAAIVIAAIRKKQSTGGEPEHLSERKQVAASRAASERERRQYVRDVLNELEPGQMDALAEKAIRAAVYDYPREQRFIKHRSNPLACPELAEEIVRLHLADQGGQP